MGDLVFRMITLQALATRCWFAYCESLKWLQEVMFTVMHPWPAMFLLCPWYMKLLATRKSPESFAFTACLLSGLR